MQKCSYCDFFSVELNSQAPQNLKLIFDLYKNELLTRIQLEPELTNLKLDSIFFGGGTPSIADPKDYEDFILFVKKNLQLELSSEITIECNPENINSNYLNELHNAGINRLSVGIQSFEEKNLTTLERIFHKKNYDSLLNNLQNSKFSNISCDLIYGIPGQTKETFYEDLRKLLNSKIQHLSLYSLTAEKNTPYFRKIRTKNALPPNEILQSEILEEISPFLKSFGFYHYEVSNFAKEGFYSKHNLKYWTMEYYLGLGAGAHGFTPRGRYANSKNLQKYFDKELNLQFDSPSIKDELALTLFRIFLPIQLNSFLHIYEEKKEEVEKLIQDWSKKGICTFHNGVFQWNNTSILHLDNLIFELANL
ncbi:MAG: radical SAM family heme chaperone HemW [Leptospiraceae bacterium]|nr:radical SAM family heme chaperone HemW [Leptospiraceae bacterium]